MSGFYYHRYDIIKEIVLNQAEKVLKIKYVNLCCITDYRKIYNLELIILK